jgi:predicted ester cyclase
MSSMPERVMRTWFDEVWNQGREASIDTLLAPNGVAHGLPGGSLVGPESFRQIFSAFRGAFPDIHVAIERTVTEGEYIAVYCRVTGTHTGGGLGLAPTNRAVDFHGTVIARVTDGLLQEGWNVFDFLSMYQQLGTIPALPGS